MRQICKIQRPNYAFNPIAELALRSKQTIVPQRVNAALDVSNMIPAVLRPKAFGTLAQESWEDYICRVGLPSNEALAQFYRQVLYDHFDNFTSQYPAFNLRDYYFELIHLSASEVRKQVVFPKMELLEDWAEQFDVYERRNYDYIIYQRMATDLTFPFPPILMSLRPMGERKEMNQAPFELVEGTHRVGYLRRMLTRGLITPESQHRFVLLTPNDNGEK